MGDESLEKVYTSGNPGGNRITPSKSMVAGTSLGSAIFFTDLQPGDGADRILENNYAASRFGKEGRIKYCFRFIKDDLPQCLKVDDVGVRSIYSCVGTIFLNDIPFEAKLTTDDGEWLRSDEIRFDMIVDQLRAHIDQANLRPTTTIQEGDEDDDDE